MTIVQYGLILLGGKTSDKKRLLRALVTVAADAKRWNTDPIVIQEFLKDVCRKTYWLQNPMVLRYLWKQYRIHGTIERDNNTQTN